MEVGTLFLGNVKNNAIVSDLLSFVFKLSGLNGYLKGYLKSKINQLKHKEINYY